MGKQIMTIEQEVQAKLSSILESRDDLPKAAASAKINASSGGELVFDLKDWCKFFMDRNKEILKECEFSSVTDEDDDTKEENKKLTAILYALKYLTSEATHVVDLAIATVKKNGDDDLAQPSLETLWVACLVGTSTPKLLEIIGGLYGEQLPNFGTTQLLLLIGWVEYFHDTLLKEDNFGLSLTAGLLGEKRIHLHSLPSLWSDDNEESVNTAEEVNHYIAFHNNMLSDAYQAAKIDFIYRTKEKAEEDLGGIYLSKDRESMQTLDEDIYEYIGKVLNSFEGHLSSKSEARIQIVGILFKALYDAQKANRDKLLGDNFENCCMGSNVFAKMKEKCQGVVTQIHKEYPALSDAAKQSLANAEGALTALYASDAVYAAKKISYFVFKDIEEAEDITPKFFTSEWQDDLTNNDLAKRIVTTIEDYMTDMEKKLDSAKLLVAKEALATRFVNYYVDLLLKTATTHYKSGRDDPYFSNVKLALERMEGDRTLVCEFFKKLTGGQSPSSMVENFEVLEAIMEIMKCVSDLSDDDIRDYIYAYQQYIETPYDLMYATIGYFCCLVSPPKVKEIQQVMEGMKEDLVALEKETNLSEEYQKVPGLSIIDVLMKHTDKKDAATGDLYKYVQKDVSSHPKEEKAESIDDKFKALEASLNTMAQENPGLESEFNTLKTKVEELQRVVQEELILK